MNRRDNATTHHTGLQLSLQSINAYLDRGVPPEKANLGFAFYTKWYLTDPRGGCDKNPIGCKTMVMEDPATGVDLGQAGAFSWHDPVPPELEMSFSKTLNNSVYDSVGGGNYFWDATENIWWSWDTSEAIKAKFPPIVEALGLGGVFAWGLGEDAPKFTHFKALMSAMQNSSKTKTASLKGFPPKLEL